MNVRMTNNVPQWIETDAGPNVLSTTDYDRLEIDPSNRPIYPKHLEDLIESIKRKNLLHLFPIVVSSEGVVRDGQHRLMAAKACGVPIFYIMSDTISIDDVAKVNAVNRRWTMQDAMHHFVVERSPEYVKLKNFIDHYDIGKVPITTLCFICTKPGYPNGKSGTVQAFRNGDWLFNNLPKATEIVKALLDYKRFNIAFWYEQRFSRAVARCFAIAGYDHKHMLMKLEYMSTHVVKCADQKSYAEMLHGIYNYRTRPQDHVDLRI